MSLVSHRYLCGAVLIAAIAVATADANIFPSAVKITSVTPGGVTVRYILNEDADGSGGNPGAQIRVLRATDHVAVKTVQLTAPAAGTRRGASTWTWDKTDDASNPVPQGEYYFEIIASDDGYAVWTQISDDADNNNKYNSLRGVAVNRNPASPYYGRIYISNSAAGTVSGGPTLGDGIYMRNADCSDSDVGQGFTARTGGQNWTLSANSPFRLRVGEDDNLFIADYSDAHSGVYMADPDVNGAVDVLDSSDRASGGLSSVHGSIVGSAVPVGTLAGGDLQIYAIDEDYPSPINSLMRWDVNAGPLPSTNPPTLLNSPLLAVFNVICDVARAPDGKLFLMQYRFEGSDVASVFVLSPDGGTVLWDSMTATHAIDPGANDYLRQCYGGIALTSDGSMMAIAKYASQTMIVPIDPGTGLPDLASRVEVASGSVAYSRGIDLDAVGNVYLVTSGHARLRVWSPPTGANSSTTQSGTFTTAGPTILTNPQSQTVCSPGVPSVQLSVTATGTGTLSYLWLKNNSPLANGGHYSGVTTNQLTISPVDAGDLGVYRVEVTDSNGTTPSEEALLAMYAAPTITANPQTQMVTAGDSVGFSVGASSAVTPTPTLSYQWRLNDVNLTDDGVNVVGATTANLMLHNVAVSESGAKLHAVVTDTCGQSASSTVATLLVVEIPCHDPFADSDGDGDVDMYDFGVFQSCFSGLEFYTDPACRCFDRDGNDVVNALDLGDPWNPQPNTFMACFSGAAIPADPDCDGEAASFFEDFDVDHTANWVVNKGPNPDGSSANFFFDYSTVGIPAAPGSNGTTRGLRLTANVTGATFSGLSVSPAGQSFSGDYTLECYMWLNYNGPLNGGGVGSTQVTGLGIGTAGGVATWAGSGAAIDSVHFGMTGEGGSSADFRAYSSAATTSYQDGSSVYIAGPELTNRNSIHPYYSVFGGQAAPAAQLALFSSQTGVTDVGATGFAWRHVKVVKSGNFAIWIVDGTPLVFVDLTTVALGGGNILFNQYDINATVATDPDQLLFGLIDNVRVSPN